MSKWRGLRGLVLRARVRGMREAPAEAIRNVVLAGERREACEVVAVDAAVQELRHLLRQQRRHVLLEPLRSQRFVVQRELQDLVDVQSEGLEGTAGRCGLDIP